MIRGLLLASLVLAVACNEGEANFAVSNEVGPGDLAAAGAYRLQGQPDIASGLLLSPDGRFEYYLAAGALDSRAQGRWHSDGRVITLNTEPRPTPPEFTAGAVTRSDEAPLTVIVNAPEGQSVAGVDLRIGFSDGRVIEGHTQGYGWRPEAGAPPGEPRWVELSLQTHGVAPKRFQLDPRRGNSFAFTLTFNDLGIADFRDQAFDITPRGLVRRGSRGGGVYVREQIERRETK